MTIDRETHARMFARYLGNCSLSELRAILADAEECARQQLNGNVASQSRAYGRARLTIDATVNRMLESDLQYIEKIVAP